MANDVMFIFAQGDLVTSAFHSNDLDAMTWAESLADTTWERRKEKVFLVRFGAPLREYWKLPRDMDWNLVLRKNVDIDRSNFAIIDFEWAKAKENRSNWGERAAV